ncbi:hypothetical protein HK100_008433 [Physocladia obscura]|uniref:type I protein arginine methyltransferase n=1 Tax=Physocladia obscura TaxID=109957 RepID=A0AAD5TA11_9FUNG|nr:hypothetical protein HK100_008433 [Physocladia obscura]
MNDLDDDIDNDNSIDEWIEDDATPCRCLLCPAVLPDPDATLAHLTSAHAFDLAKTHKLLALDFYAGIRLVNYIRAKSNADPSFNVASVIENRDSWISDDAYLIPVIENDPLLYALDFDDDDDDVNNDEETAIANQFSNSVFLETSNSNADKKKIHSLEHQLAELKAAFSEYKDHVRDTFLREKDSSSSSSLPSSSTISLIKQTTVENKKEETAWEMDYYFGSYAETEIHETMLKDVVRTDSYRDCFYSNKDFFKNKIVLDVGCGTGILSMFAAKSGAKHVYAVDNSTIILKAKEIAAKNNLADKITFIRGEIESITLPVAKVDVIVSEWMGYFLLFEGMFDSVITARDRWLAPNDGIMAPSHADILIAGLEDEEWINDKLNFWNDVYGFDYTPMKDTFCTDGQVDVVSPRSIITEAVVLKVTASEGSEYKIVKSERSESYRKLDLATITSPELDFKTPFTLKFTKPGRLHALCGWFDIRFEFPHKDANPIFFSTSPMVKPTHWKQTSFPLEVPVDVNAGTVFEGVFVCKKSKENVRELDVVISYVDPNTKTERSQKFTVR